MGRQASAADAGVRTDRFTTSGEAAGATLELRASAAGVIPAPRGGGVATWLPEGRWADPEEGRPDATATGSSARRGAPSAGGDADDERRRRGRRRVARARMAAHIAGWPRRVVAAALLLAALVLALRPDAPPTALDRPPGVAVVVAARDLPAGRILAGADLRTASLPADVAPAGGAQEMRALLGRTLAGPVRRGEPVTDARLVGPALTTGLGPEESSAVPVRLADAQAAALVRPADRVDVLGTSVDATGRAGAADAIEVATAVRVLAVLRGDQASDGVVLVVATGPAIARRLAGAAGRYRLTVTVRPP